MSHIVRGVSISNAGKKRKYFYTHKNSMRNKHIALIYTGGTVGMMKTESGYAPMPDFKAVLTKMLKSVVLPKYTLHVYASPSDSVNTTPQDWQNLGRRIAAHYTDYDGFVILHGTDAMAYTASALSFMLRGLRKPVIMTGSQIPLAQPRSDALQNIVTALQLATSDRLNEVAIYFNYRLLRANRCSKWSSLHFDALRSPNYPWLAEVGIDVRWNTSALLPCASKEAFELPDYRSGEVLSFELVPGISPSILEAFLALQPRALILHCRQTGVVPDHDPALIDLLIREHRKGVILVACEQSSRHNVVRSTNKACSDLDECMVNASNMTFEAIFTKLHHLLALGLSGDDARTALVHDLCGELLS